MGKVKLLSTAELNQIKKRLSAGESSYQIAEALGRSHSGIHAIKVAFKAGKLDELIKRRRRDPSGQRPGIPHKPELRAKILDLRKTGMRPAEIARTLNLYPSAVYYHTHRAKLGGHHKPATPEVTGAQTNGAISNGHGTFDKKILIGIAFAETERFLAVLSERLGIPAAVLRPRLSELLGRSPLR